jgi:hypothetical protein
MSADQPAQCPECGEEAIHQPPADLVPWEAHGIARPEWSHKDGSSLCPVIGQSGGYQPAQPEHRHAEPGVPAVRLDPLPPCARRHGPSQRADRLGPVTSAQGSAFCGSRPGRRACSAGGT